MIIFFWSSSCPPFRFSPADSAPRAVERGSSGLVLKTGSGDNEVLHDTVSQGFKKYLISYFMLSLFLCKGPKDILSILHVKGRKQRPTASIWDTGAGYVCAPVHGREAEGIRPVQCAVSSLRAPFLHI